MIFLSVLFVNVLQAQESIEVSNDANAQVAIQPDSLVTFASSLLGVPYCYGGSSPLGFDCSGFVNYVFGYFGMELPRSSVEMADIGVEVPLDSCHKGDIILFAGSNAKKRPVGHAGIVISEANEPLKFIHSATSNKIGIIITAFDAFDYYKSRFVKVVRVVANTPE